MANRSLPLYGPPSFRYALQTTQSAILAKSPTTKRIEYSGSGRSDYPLPSFAFGRIYNRYSKIICSQPENGKPDDELYGIYVINMSFVQYFIRSTS